MMDDLRDKGTAGCRDTHLQSQQENQEPKVNQVYRLRLRSTWATQDHFNNTKKRKRCNLGGRVLALYAKMYT